jgi:hypothetical protein
MNSSSQETRETNNPNSKAFKIKNLWYDIKPWLLSFFLPALKT